jgi:hypothetical protein
MSNVEINAIKTATQQLITKVGGLVAAASVCRVEVAQLSRYQSRNHPDITMPIDVVWALEAVAEEAVVTATLARLHGLSVVRPDAGAAFCVGRAVAAVTRQAGAAAAAFMEASADGTIDRTEAADMQRLLEAVREAASEALAGLAAPSLRVVA